MAACLRLRPSRGLAVPFLVAGLVALNPVAVTQWTGFFVDGQMASLLSTAVACMVLVWAQGGRAPLVMLGVTVLLLVTTKFTGLVYACALVAMFVAIIAGARRPASARGVAGWMGLSLALGTVVVGANPYVTNTVRHGHPLYPLAGRGAIDVMEAQRPGGFESAGRITRLLISTFARSASVKAPVAPSVKWPLAVTADEFRSFAVADVRAAGFGPLFAAALAVAAGAWLALWRQDRAVAASTTMIAAGLLVSVLINPEAWWARFAPQLWLVPVVVAFAGTCATHRAARWLSGVVLGLLVVNAGGITFVHAQAAVGRTRVVRAQLHALAAMPQPLRVHFGAFYSNRVRLLEYGIRYLDMDLLRCPRVDALAYSETRVCVPQ